MRITLVTDAWAPQVNGVVRTLTEMTRRLETLGHVVDVISPDQYWSMPCPSYPEIRLALVRQARIGQRIDDFAPHAIHIATEGPLGFAARRHCIAAGMPFTTAYHTQFPDYLAERTGIPATFFWPFIRRFHGPAAQVLVSTERMARQLAEQGIGHSRQWGRGVDLDCFHPAAPPPPSFAELPGPIMLYVGRIAVEKNIEAFLSLDRPGAKILVGDGPARTALEREYPHAHFLGPLSGAALAGAYAGADVFVFPSRTDTFGLVMIEALASGTPVAAYPVQGPLDVLNEASGAMDEDLGAAIDTALALDPADCIAHARRFSWETSAAQFIDALVPIRQYRAAA